MVGPEGIVSRKEEETNSKSKGEILETNRKEISELEGEFSPSAPPQTVGGGISRSDPAVESLEGPSTGPAKTSDRAPAGADNTRQKPRREETAGLRCPHEDYLRDLDQQDRDPDAFEPDLPGGGMSDDLGKPANPVLSALVFVFGCLPLRGLRRLRETTKYRHFR